MQTVELDWAFIQSTYDIGIREWVCLSVKLFGWIRILVVFQSHNRPFWFAKSSLNQIPLKQVYIWKLISKLSHELSKAGERYIKLLKMKWNRIGNVTKLKITREKPINGCNRKRWSVELFIFSENKSHTHTHKCSVLRSMEFRFLL